MILHIDEFIWFPAYNISDKLIPFLIKKTYVIRNYWELILFRDTELKIIETEGDFNICTNLIKWVLFYI